jgi:hypothetical protein
VLLEKQRRHVGCARCVDGEDAHDARSGTACRAPTGRKLKAPAGASGTRDKNKRAGSEIFRFYGGLLPNGNTMEWSQRDRCDPESWSLFDFAMLVAAS